MDSQPTLTVPGIASPKRRKRRALRFLFVVFAILLIIVLFFTFTTSHNEKFVWLIPGELALASQPGPLTRFRSKVVRLTAPLWRWHRKNRPQITIHSSIVTLPAMAEPAGLGAPLATNATGMRAWILSPPAAKTFMQKLKTAPGMSVLSSPQLSTIDGGQGRVGMLDMVPVANKFIPVGITIDLLPKVMRNSVNLAVAATFTEMAPPSSGRGLTIQTNFATGCRVAVPNGGSLVIEGDRRMQSGTNYWLIVSPTATDARGNPIKL